MCQCKVERSIVHIFAGMSRKKSPDAEFFPASGLGIDVDFHSELLYPSHDNYIIDEPRRAEFAKMVEKSGEWG